MPHHRTRQRKQRRPNARWLVTGSATTRILHHNQRAYLQPVRAGDHPKRYAAGQHLALKHFVPGPTDANLIITSVERIPLGQITDPIARDLGHEGIETFRLAWVRHNDTDWWARLEEHSQSEEGILEDPMVAYEKTMRRFEHRWTRKLAWLIRFRIDNTAPPHLLAARSDELYTENPAMALRDELPALRPDEWERHVGPRSPYRQRDQLRAQRVLREAHSIPTRLAHAEAHARAAGIDIRSETRRLERLLEQGNTSQAKQQIALIEQRALRAAA